MVPKLNATATEIAIESTSPACNGSPASKMVEESYQKIMEDESNSQHNGSWNGNGFHEHTESYSPSIIRRLLSTILLSFETIAVSIYKCIGVGLHAGLALAFLAAVAVFILALFHDRYWVTLLNRARRTDSDLQYEITYFNRRCDATDVTTSKFHHIHFGEVNDTASEMFIDVDKIMNEMEYEDEPDYFLHEKGYKARYQTERPARRRRYFGQKYEMWDEPMTKPIPKDVAKEAGRQGVNAMMKHGTVMIPQILSANTIGHLRAFIDKKNEKVSGTDDEYPMTAHHHRISYGIESTEHPAVIQALKEIHDHRVFAELIQNLVGDENPALSEITAITSWEGAEDQGWHPDVKPDGNGVMFGRTYSHSYSLFLPLQNTNAKMGVTELCPGTHYCATESMWEVCEENKIGVHEVRKARPRSEYSNDEEGEEKYQHDLSMNGIWRAGDGALLNQQGWHRGSGHSDPDGQDRIVFIVSFLKRPNSDDPRQLARGTYFHQKWLNWGSTWEDMTDAWYNIRRPWNILRCLHLYKPSDRSWGYDLFTATTLRVANNQMGGEPEDLDGVLDNVMEPYYPDWLQGDVDYDSEDCWRIYMQGTIRRTFYFLKRVNIYALIGLAAFLVISAILGSLYNRLIARVYGSGGSERSVVAPVFKSGVGRMLLTHGSILALGFYVWHVVICSSQWAIDIDSGKTYMRPFPMDPVYRDDDPGALGSNTTLPRRSDVLIGTRMDTKATGAYKTWFEYHIGNRLFDQFVEWYGGTGSFYHSVLSQNREKRTSSGLPSGFSNRLEDSAFDMVTKHHGGGRFLMQDYRSGDWKILSETESRNYIRKRLLIGGKDSNALAVVHDEINLLLDKQRFSFVRNALSMSWLSQLFLHDLSKEIFATKIERETRKKQMSNSITVRQPSLIPSASVSAVLPQLRYRLPRWESISPTVSGVKDKEGHRVFLVGRESPSFRPGMEIILEFHDDDLDEASVHRGTIVDFSIKKSRDGQARYKIMMDEDGVSELGAVGIENVPRRDLFPAQPVSTGTRVSARIEEGGSYFDGYVLLVVADGSVDVQFDDGDREFNIHYSDYDVIHKEPPNAFEQEEE